MGNFATAIGNLTETAGQGAASVRASWMSFVTPFVESLNESHSGMVRFVGGMMEIGVVAGTTLGPVVGVLFQLHQAWKVNAIAANTAAAANAANAGAAGAAGAANAGAAGRVGLLTAAYWKNVAASGAAKLGVAAFAIGAAYGIASAAVALGNMNRKMEDQVDLLTEISKGWAVATGRVKEYQGQVGTTLYEKDLEKVEKEVADLREQGKSEEELDEYRRRRQLYIEEHYKRQFKDQGFDKEYAEHSQRAADLRKQAPGKIAGSSTDALTMPVALDFNTAGTSASIEKTGKKIEKESKSATKSVTSDLDDINRQKLEAADFMYTSSRSRDTEEKVALLMDASTIAAKREREATEARIKALETSAKNLSDEDQDAVREQIETLRKASEARINNERAATERNAALLKAQTDYDIAARENAITKDMDEGKKALALARLDDARKDLESERRKIESRYRASLESVPTVQPLNLKSLMKGNMFTGLMPYREVTPSGGSMFNPYAAMQQPTGASRYAPVSDVAATGSLSQTLKAELKRVVQPSGVVTVKVEVPAIELPKDQLVNLSRRLS
jgi:hypothetical protein